MRVVLAEDNALLRAGLAELLRQEEIDVVGQAADVPHLLRLVRDTRPDVAVLDVRMPPTHTVEGLEAAKQIRADHGDAVGILVLSHHLETRYALDLLADGAHGVGYLLKDRVLGPGDLADAIRRVAAGGSAIDPQVIEHLLKRRRSDIPLVHPDRAGAGGAHAGRRGQVEPVGRRRDAREREDRRGLHRTHLRQARAD